MATKPADLPRSPRVRAEWAKSPERGSLTLLRVMTFVSLRLGRPVGRFFLFFIALYFFLFAPTARRHSRDYLWRALGRPPTAGDRFRQVFYFASNILDRLYLVNERYDLFDVAIEGEELMRDQLARGTGAFMMGAHFGSFEIMSAVGRRQPGLRVAMAMYEENARKVSAMFKALNPANKSEVIALGQIEAMLRIRERLDEGVFVGILGDRSFGGEPGLVVDFLGGRAVFPLGPMRAAAVLRQPVFFMTGVYKGGNRYQAVFDKLADFSDTRAGEREAAVDAAIRRYAMLLEERCRRDPYNWFNFFDFWRGAADEHRK
jgi:predicted LPLAT superfamily acyltransferase